MYKYIEYFIKCIIRQFTRLLFKPKILFIVVILILILLFLNSSSFAAVQETEDQFLAGKAKYENIINDMIVRIDNSTSDGLDLLKNKLQDTSYGYYVYYGNNDGSSVLNINSTLLTTDLKIFLYKKSNSTLGSSLFSNYYGYSLAISSISTSDGYLFTFSGNILSYLDLKIYETSLTVNLPSSFYSYTSDSLSSYFTNSSGSSDVVQSIENLDNTVKDQTVAIQDTTNSVNNLNDSINREDKDESSSDINETFSSVSSSTSDFDGDVNSIVDFIKSLHDVLLNAVNKVGDEVLTVEIGLPFVDKKLTLRSDIIYNALYPSILYTLLQLSYVVAFGFYIIMTVYNIIDWVTSGEVIRGTRVQHRNLIVNTLFR